MTAFGSTARPNDREWWVRDSRLSATLMGKSDLRTVVAAPMKSVKRNFLRFTVDAAQLQRSTYSIKDEVVVQFIDVILFAGKSRHAARQAV